MESLARDIAIRLKLARSRFHKLDEMKQLLALREAQLMEGGDLEL